jgi:hypothetical protein
LKGILAKYPATLSLEGDTYFKQLIVRDESGNIVKEFNGVKMVTVFLGTQERLPMYPKAILEIACPSDFFLGGLCKVVRWGNGAHAFLSRDMASKAILKSRYFKDEEFGEPGFKNAPRLGDNTHKTSFE